MSQASFLSPADDGLPPTAAPTAETLIGRLQSSIADLSSEQIGRIFDLAAELREEDGAYLSPKETVQRRDSPGNGFDLMPLVLGGEEWAHLEEGLVQRIRGWNYFLRDIYTGQEILKAGVVPYEIVYADPNFHRGCARLTSALPNYLQLTAFDLQRTARGQWQVMQDHLSVAEGASYALRKRQIMRQIAPRLFEGVEVLPIEDFAVQVMDILKEWLRKPDGRVRGVLLARGSSDEHYLDHASLARQMGVSIVQGTDLVVLDGRLYLKTIAGMDRVDVVLRRLATSQLDPVTFDGGSRFGVPGLLSCVRKGELAMANGMGSDLADNRALAAYLPAIIEYYIGEKAILPSTHVLELRDIDIREEVADRRDKYVIRHAWKRGPEHEWSAANLDPASWDAFWKRVDLAPQEFVAHRTFTPATYPAWTPSGLQSVPVTLRAFGLGENRISPCALAWTGGGAMPTPTMMQAGDRIKDVWILRHTATPAFAIYARAEEAPKRLRLTSRVAEAFFWMGRYAERAEVITRTVRIAQMQAWPTGAGAFARQRQPFWSAMAAISAHKPDFFLQEDKMAARAHDLPFYFLLDREHEKSVLSSLQKWRQNAENIREHFPPEVWSVLNRLYLQVALHADQAATENVQQTLEDRSLHHEILTQLDELTGALEKHMLHNDAWHFWQLGVYAERSVTTLLALRQVLAAPQVEPDFAGATNLDLLLQMLAGQYAYRSLFHARPVAARVAQLLLQDDVFPRSALFCLHHMKRALAATLGENPTRGSDTPLKHCRRVITELEEIDIGAYFPRATSVASPVSGDEDFSSQPTPAFSAKLEEVIALIYEFNGLISDHYLNHQVVIREPELFDLTA